MPLTAKEAAKQVRDAGFKWMYPDYETDTDDLASRMGDANDLQKVADLIEAEDFKAAKHKASSLDTIVRDCIPNNVWHWLFS